VEDASDRHWPAWLVGRDGDHPRRVERPEPVIATHARELLHGAADKVGRPTVLELDGHKLKVIRVWDNWGVYEEGSGTRGTGWHVALEDGRAVLVFRDLVNGGWFLAR